MFLPLNDAIKAARSVEDALAEYCEKIMVVGSVRRQRPHCNNLNLVMIPKPGNEPDIIARCLRRADIATKEPLHVTFYYRRLDIGIDLWFAHGDITDMFNPAPSNWGALCLWRTGSRTFNLELEKHAHALGLMWDHLQGFMRGADIVASTTEEEIFETLKLPFIQPQDRETGILAQYATKPY